MNNILYERLNDLDEVDLIVILGKSLTPSKPGEELKKRDKRFYKGMGKKWYAELKSDIKEKLCSHLALKNFVFDDQVTRRTEIATFVVAFVLANNFDLKEEEATAFAVLLLREGIQTYCNDIWSD